MNFNDVSVPSCEAPLSEQTVALVAESYRVQGWLGRKVITLRLMWGALTQKMCPTCYIRCCVAIGKVKLSERP